MKGKQLSLELLFTFFCLSVISSSAYGETDPREARDLQQAQEMEIQALSQGEENGLGPRPQSRIQSRAAQFLPADMDDDGMADAWETANGLNPGDPDDAWVDPDNDTVVNLFEHQLGSGIHNPTSPAVITVGAANALYTDVKTALDSVTEAVPGKVIRVAGGTYPLNYMTFSSKVVMIQGGWSPDFSSRDLKLYSTTFDGELTNEIIYFSVGSGRPVIVLDGIHFVNAKGSFGAINLLAQNTTYMRTSIFNCSITGSEAATATGSLVTTNRGGVLSIFNWNTSEADRTIANTIIGGNNGDGIDAHITGDTTARWRIINTTISNNKNIGSNGMGVDVFTLSNGILNAHIYNTSLWGNDQEAIKAQGNITFNVDHSDISNVSTTIGASYRPGMGILNTDPLYADPTSADYHLQESSPLIDAGVGTGIPRLDFEGELRIAGPNVDIGADEVFSQPQASGDGGINCGNKINVGNVGC